MLKASFRLDSQIPTVPSPGGSAELLQFRAFVFYFNRRTSFQVEVFPSPPPAPCPSRNFRGLQSRFEMEEALFYFIF